MLQSNDKEASLTLLFGGLLGMSNREETLPEIQTSIEGLYIPSSLERRGNPQEELEHLAWCCEDSVDGWMDGSVDGCAKRSQGGIIGNYVCAQFFVKY